MDFRHQHLIVLGALMCLLGLALETNAQCIPAEFCGAETILVESSGHNTDPTYGNWFVLVDQASGLIVAANASGNFTGEVSNGLTYQVHGLNFKLTEPPSVIASLDPEDLVGLDLLSLNDGCYDPNFQNEFICFTYSEDCLCDGENLVLSDPLPNASHAQTSLTSDGTVNAGQQTTFKAGQYLQFSPGFVAEQQSSFEAIIEDCVTAN